MNEMSYIAFHDQIKRWFMEEYIKTYEYSKFYSKIRSKRDNFWFVCCADFITPPFSVQVEFPIPE